MGCPYFFPFFLCYRMSWSRDC